MTRNRDIMPECPVEGCDKPIRGGGLCMKHYQRVIRNGDPLLLRGPRYSICVLCAKSIIRQKRVVVNEANHHGNNGKRLAHMHATCWEKLVRAVEMQQRNANVGAMTA